MEYLIPLALTILAGGLAVLPHKHFTRKAAPAVIIAFALAGVFVFALFGFGTTLLNLF